MRSPGRSTRFHGPPRATTRPAREAPRAEPTVARQLNDAISRLDARLSQISNQAPRQPTVQERQRQTEMVERAAAQVYRPSPPLSPVSFDSAIAEIAARQNELDGVPPRQMPPRSAPPMARRRWRRAPRHGGLCAADAAACTGTPHLLPMPAGPDFSSLERHLLKITSQIEALQRPDNVEQSIAAFRTELADIRRAITEAMPRQAIDSIETEIRSLSRRIDETRQNGTDADVLANLERALGEIYDALRALKPAEQLTGYDDAIRNLGTKLDLILRSNDDPSTVRQLEDAISAMRSIAANVASNDALARVSDDLHALSAKVDQLSRAGDNSESLASLEQRIAALTSSIETRERPVASDNSEYIEGALRSLSERLDRIPAGNDNASAFTHLEQRVTYLLERLETSGGPGGSGGGNLGRVEEGLQDILRHLEHQHANLARLADNTSSYCGAAADGFRHRRSRQARIVGHPLQPVGNRPPHPGFAGDGSQHARPCGRSPRDDRRRSARGSRRAACGSARPALTKPAKKRRARRCRRRASRRRPTVPQAQPAAQALRRSRNRNCRIPPPRRSILPPHRANSMPRSR